MARACRLTAKDFADDAVLAEHVYRVLEGQRGRRARSSKIQQLQRRLRKLVDDRVWSTYLSIEEAVNDRADRELQVVARWAFQQGRREAGTRPRSAARGRRSRP
jgi:hypothetical protein